MSGRAPEPGPAAAPVRRLVARELLRGAREVEIELDGRIYRLRLTGQNKLLLTA